MEAPSSSPALAKTEEAGREGERQATDTHYYLKKLRHLALIWLSPRHAVLCPTVQPRLAWNSGSSGLFVPNAGTTGVKSIHSASDTHRALSA